MAKQPVQSARQPNQSEIQPALNFLSTGKLTEAESAAKKLASIYPNAFILHHILGLAQDGLSKFTEAAASYSRALAIQPNRLIYCLI